MPEHKYWLKDLNNKGKIVKEASQIPNILNKHFATIGNRLASKLPSPPKHHLGLYYIYKSYGLYSSPIKLLKLSSFIIAPVLSEILNLSIKLANYPSKLKIAKITPIFKCDDEADANNYRPISLLSNFNRIFD